MRRLDPVRRVFGWTVLPLLVAGLIYANVIRGPASGSLFSPIGEARSIGRDCPLCPEMIALPGGEYRRGAMLGEDGSSRLERPVTKVVLPRFAIAARETTFVEWDACVADGFCRAIENDEGWGRGDRPVIHVSWRDVMGARGGASGAARGFIAWLNSKTSGAPYRLPSETEWEYAARAGTRTPFYVGRTIYADEANFDASRPYRRFQSEGPKSAGTKPVGGYAPNGFGLFDMHGNVAEWTADCVARDGDYKGAPTDGSALLTPARPSSSGGCERVVRGGGWSSPAYAIRSAARARLLETRSSAATGFRVAKSLPAEEE